MLNWLKQRLVDIVAWFSDLFVAIFSAAWDFMKDAVCWGFEQVSDLFISSIASIDVSGLANYSSSFGNLPSDVINVLGLLGFGQAAGIIMSAVLIRLTIWIVKIMAELAAHAL